jgi:tryptophan synthase beta chain
LFAAVEGVVPAPESAHAVKAAIELALEAKRRGATILFNMSGHGLLDLAAYDEYIKDVLVNYVPTRDEISRCIPVVEVFKYILQTAVWTSPRCWQK